MKASDFYLYLHNICICFEKSGMKVFEYGSTIIVIHRGFRHEILPNRNNTFGIKIYVDKDLDIVVYSGEHEFNPEMDCVQLFAEAAENGKVIDNSIPF